MENEEIKEISSLLGLIDDDSNISKSGIGQYNKSKFKKYSRLKPCKLKEGNSTTIKYNKDENNV